MSENLLWVLVGFCGFTVLVNLLITLANCFTVRMSQKFYTEYAKEKFISKRNS